MTQTFLINFVQCYIFDKYFVQCMHVHQCRKEIPFLQSSFLNCCNMIYTQLPVFFTHCLTFHTKMTLLKTNYEAVCENGKNGNKYKCTDKKYFTCIIYLKGVDYKLIGHLPCYQISRIYYSLICLKILFYSANKNAAFWLKKIAPHVYPCNFSGQGHCCDYENHTRCIR